MLLDAGADDVVDVLAVDEVVVADGDDPLEHDASRAAAAANTTTGTRASHGQQAGHRPSVGSPGCRNVDFLSVGCVRVPRPWLERRWSAMPDTVDSLILDLLEWIGPASRPYDEVMEAWRTSCPRLPVWEEATRRGLVLRSRDGDNRSVVSVSAAGVCLLEANRQPSVL